MRRRNIITRLEKQSKVPDKLEPQKIKDMLDEISAIKPVIESERSSGIKLNSGKGSFIRTIAAAAFFVLAVAGLAAVLFTGGSKNIKVSPKTQPPQVADASGLTGLRGGSYSSLYNHLKDSIDGYSDFYIDTGYDDSYAFTADSEKDMDYYAYNSSMYRLIFGSKAPDNGVSAITDAAYNAEDDSELLPTLVKQHGTSAFSAGYTAVSAYRLQGGETEKVENDLLSQLKINGVLKDNEVCKEFSHTAELYTTGLYVTGDRLIAVFDFILPDVYDSHIVLNEYCGFGVYDISDTDNISLVYEYEQPGVMEDARLTEEGRFVILSSYTKAKTIASYIPYREGIPEFLPMIYENGEVLPAAEDRIYIANRYKGTRLTLISEFGFTEEEKEKTDSELSETAASTGSSQAAHGEFYKTGEALIAATANTIAQAEDCMLLVCGYVDPNSEDDYAVQLIKLGLEGGTGMITAAEYSDNEKAYMHPYEILSGFSEYGGHYYFSDTTGASVFDKELNTVGGAVRNNFVNYDGFTDLYSDYGSVISGGTVYFYDSISSSPSDSYICMERADLSDPYSPVITTDQNELSKVCLIGTRQGFILGDKVKISPTLAFSLERTDQPAEDGYDPTALMKGILYTLDPQKTETETARYMYADDGALVTPHEEFTRSAPHRAGETEIFTEDHIKNDAHGDIKYQRLTDIYDEQNGIIFVPMHSYDEKTHEMTPEEFEDLPVEDSPRVDYRWDENGKISYYYLDDLTESISVMAVKVDEQSGSAEISGTAVAAELSISDFDSEEMSFIGGIYLNGKLYAFSTCGMSCTSLKDGKVLYSDTLSVK